MYECIGVCIHTAPMATFSIDSLTINLTINRNFVTVDQFLQKSDSKKLKSIQAGKLVTFVF